MDWDKNQEKRLNEDEMNVDEEKKKISAEWNRIELEKRMLKEQSRLFDQKLDILKEAYLQLDKDRRKVEWEQLKLKAEREQTQYGGNTFRQNTEVSAFFRGVTNQLALKKRYRDLIKIFHTDNLYGDKETLQAINREYERLQERYDVPWRKKSSSNA